MEGTAVFGGARRTQRCVQNAEVNFFSKTGTQAPDREINGSIKAESS